MKGLVLGCSSSKGSATGALAPLTLCCLPQRATVSSPYKNLKVNVIYLRVIYKVNVDPRALHQNFLSMKEESSDTAPEF